MDDIKNFYKMFDNGFEYFNYFLHWVIASDGIFAKSIQGFGETESFIGSQCTQFDGDAYQFKKVNVIRNVATSERRGKKIITFVLISLNKKNSNVIA